MAILIENGRESWYFPWYILAFCCFLATAICVIPPGACGETTAFRFRNPTGYSVGRQQLTVGRQKLSDLGTELEQNCRSMSQTLIENSVFDATISQSCMLSSQLLRRWLWLTTTQSCLDRHLHTYSARAVFNKVVWLAGFSRTHRKINFCACTYNAQMTQCGSKPFPTL